MNEHASTQVNNPDNSIIRKERCRSSTLLTHAVMRWQGSRMNCLHRNSNTNMRQSPTWEEINNRPSTRIGKQMNAEDGAQKKKKEKQQRQIKKHYSMQMIWLLGVVVPAKKVHFSLNGSELRGFPMKARSGQSSILYANPLARKAVCSFCLCPAVICLGQSTHGGCLSKHVTFCFASTLL